MADERDLETRVTALEQRFDAVADDAAVARHLAAARDRDLSEFAIKIDANRQAINALGVQVNGRFDAVDQRFDAVDRRFDAVDRRFDAVERRLDAHDQRFDAHDRRFDGVDQRFDALEAKVGAGFAEMRGRLDATAAGQQTIVDLLTTLIDRPDPPDPDTR